jgi:hypothetical protein
MDKEQFFDKMILPPIAQLAEQIPLKDKVVGSTPTGRTNYLAIRLLSK